MTKDSISDYSTTAGSNTDIDGINIDEGMSPSNVNNSLRALMSHLAKINDGTHSFGTVKVDNLQLDGNAITSTDTNGDVTITPNGTGDVVIDGLKYPQADGTADFFLKTNGSAQLSFAQVDTASISDNAVTNAKMADDSVGSAELIDNSVGAAAINISGNGTSGQMVVSDGDGSFSYADAGGGFTPTTLSGTSQALNVGSFNFFNGGTHSGDTTLTFSSVPTNANWKYSYKAGGDAYRLNKFIHHKHFAHKILEGSGLSDLAGVRDLKFHDSGTKMYILSATDHVIYQYDLSTAFDVSTASYTSKKYELSTDHISGFDLKPDGSKVLFFTGQSSGNRTFKEIPLSTNFDLSTAGTRVNDTTTMNQADAGNFYGFHLNSDGTKIYMMGDMTGATQSIFRYELSSAYDVTSVAYGGNTANLSTIANTRAFTMSADLTRIFVADLDADYIFEFSVSSAGDLSSTIAYVTSHNIPQEVSIPTIGGIQFGDSGKKFYIGQPNVNGDINQFRVGDPHTLTLPSAVGNRLSPRDNFVPDDQVTLEFFTTDGGTNVTIIGDDVT